MVVNNLLNHDELTQKLGSLQKRQEVDIEPPQMADVLEEVDMVYDGLPMELKLLFDRDGGFYRQRFGVEDIHQKDLLWKNITTNLNRIVPEINKAMKEKASDYKKRETPKEDPEERHKDWDKIFDKHEELRKKSVEELDEMKKLEFPDFGDVFDSSKGDTPVRQPRLVWDQTKDQTMNPEYADSRSGRGPGPGMEQTASPQNEDEDEFNAEGDSSNVIADIKKEKILFKNTLYMDHEYPAIKQLRKKQEASTGSSFRITEEQKIEIELYKQTRVDPFYEHYLKDSLTFFAERQGDVSRTIGKDMPFTIDPGEMMSGAKSRPEKLRQWKYSVREALKTTDSKKYFTHGKRKRSKALIFLEETDGQGKITVNRRDFIEYFSHPICRARICAPLLTTHYFLKFNINILVWGGGITGQTEACRLGVAKAMSKYDRRTHVTLNRTKLLWHDKRQSERKKPGRFKARKSYTYKRR
jgi:small subunit ribosomal protein S9